MTRMTAEGTAQGAVVAVPEGADHTWQVSGSGADAAFVDTLVDQIGRARCIDLDRVFLAGFSVGAAFSVAYACARPEQIAAVATVAVEFQLGCTRPLSILAFHGTADPMVPFEDGAVGLSLPGVPVRGAELNMGDWAALDGCGATPETTTEGDEVTRHAWPGCADGAEVTQFRVEGGGHTWPGADPRRSVGLTTQQVDATAEMIAFFGRHGLDGR
jgi:polyhydroxybutyrate depolymerase